MIPLSDTSYRTNKFDKQINVKITTEMLYHIQTGSENRKISISEFIRYLLFLGLKSVEER